MRTGAAQWGMVLVLGMGLGLASCDRVAESGPVSAPRETTDADAPLVESGVPAADRTAPVTAAPAQRFIGRIDDVSSFPDPATSEYKDCLYSITVDLLDAEGRVLREVLCWVWAYRDRKLQMSAGLRKNEVVEFAFTPFGDRPDLQAVQRVDEISRFYEEVYFAEPMFRLNETGQERVGPYEADLSRKLVTFAVQERGENRVPTRVPVAEVAGYYGALANDLAARGIELAFVALPFRGQVIADADGPGEEVFGQREELLRALEQKGVAVADVRRAFVAHRDGGGMTDEPVYYHHDGHIADAGLRLAARETARVIRGLGAVDVDETPFQAEIIRREGGGVFYPHRQIRYADGSFLDQGSAAQVLVLGDSFALYPADNSVGFVSSANFAAQLAYELGHDVKNVSIPGRNGFLARALRRSPDLLEGVRCIVIFARFPSSVWERELDRWQYEGLQGVAPSER